MRLPRIVNGKIIAVIVFIFGTIVIIGDLTTNISMSPSYIFYTILWFLVAVFTWNERVWAAILLAVMILYDLVQSVPNIAREFDTEAKMLAAYYNTSESWIIKTGIIVYAIGFIIILYILYYVAMILLEYWNERFRKLR